MPICGLFTESWFFWVLFLQTNKTVLIPRVLDFDDIESTFSFFLFLTSCTVFFQAFFLTDFILIEILAIIPNPSSSEVVVLEPDSSVPIKYLKKRASVLR